MFHHQISLKSLLFPFIFLLSNSCIPSFLTWTPLISFLRYEDMVTDAVGSAQRLFRFSNLPLTSEVYQFLLDHNKDRSAFSLPTLRYASPTQTLFRRAWPSLIRQHSPRNATKANKYSFSHLILYKNQVYNVKKYMKKRRKRMESGYTYYSTYKRPNKPIDRWKNELNQETRARLEEACGPALQEFEYNWRSKEITQ